jgi:epoxyqueuosine reductase
MALARAVEDQARSLGFDRVAIGPADRPEHADAFQRWLDAGHAGTMDYLQRTRAERVDPERLLPGVRSVVAVALSYAPPQPEPTDWAPVARYARGRDYHEVMRPRLERLAAFIADAAGARSRVAVDTSAVLERDLAARAGLGWFGKNTNLLTPDLGSYFFIGIVLTTAALEPDAPLPDRCGTCTACLDACPTGAFTGAYVLDARRCISYLTIEHRGDVDPALAPDLGRWLFGCDVCQEVCPWNRRAATTREPAFLPPGPLGAPETLLAIDDGEFRRRFRNSALSRTKRRGLRRNAALWLGNQPRPESVPALERALADDDAVVRRAAGWALERADPPVDSSLTGGAGEPYKRVVDRQRGGRGARGPLGTPGAR